MSAVAPWMSCCSSCAEHANERARAAGALPIVTPAAPPSSSGETFSTGTGALLLIGAIFVGVVYGEKLLGKLGG